MTQQFEAFAFAAFALSFSKRAYSSAFDLKDYLFKANLLFKLLNSFIKFRVTS
jgi:hypothetical protein